ncbi:MAG: AbrB/MazE/SpoVT family DNA-binding domain-containing protein [Eubacteriales bacterium]
MPTINKKIKAHKVSVQRRNLISLPKEIREKLKIGEGDILDVRVEGNKIVMEPYKLVPSSQAYFWAAKTQKDLLEAKNDVESGGVREFSNIEEFMNSLDND